MKIWKRNETELSFLFLNINNFNIVFVGFSLNLRRQVSAWNKQPKVGFVLVLRPNSSFDFALRHRSVLVFIDNDNVAQRVFVEKQVGVSRM